MRNDSEEHDRCENTEKFGKTNQNLKENEEYLSDSDLSVGSDTVPTEGDDKNENSNIGRYLMTWFRSAKME